MLVFVVLAVGMFAGCSSDDSGSPFEGDWVSATAGRLSFDGSEWSDGEGDSGNFSYAGKYPVLTVRFVSGAGAFDRLATFIDEHTFSLCEIEPGGALVNCHDFVFDKPTLH
jgi:hypothetical protein